MSSPSSTLKKVKRSPLPGACRVPFRKTEAAAPPANTSPPPSDSDLLASMAARLAQAEAQLVTTRQEVREKEARIRELERRLSAPPPPLPRSHGTPHDNHDDLLRKKYGTLQKQVQEMEEFLNDYGMIWVGSEGVRGHKDGVWLLDSSLPRNMFAVDFDLIVRNVESLNVLAGEGSTAISTTPRGATLRRMESVPLTLYANGLVMFQGPFRPFSDPHTQQCVQDLMDGYFPSELQSQFPDGIPFKLTDQRHVTFGPRSSWGAGVCGSGQKLGGQARPSKLSSPHATSQLPGPRLSADQFLARLPPCVIRGGRVLDIRSEVSATLKGPPQPSSSSSVTLLQTPVLDQLRTRVGSPSLTTLKVRSESGDHTYLMKMKTGDTIGDVWTHLLSQTPPTSIPTSPAYQLVGGVTHQVYSDLSASLAECGLVPNATLYITKTTADKHKSSQNTDFQRNSNIS